MVTAHKAAERERENIVPSFLPFSSRRVVDWINVCDRDTPFEVLSVDDTIFLNYRAAMLFADNSTLVVKLSSWVHDWLRLGKLGTFVLPLYILSVSLQVYKR